MKKLHSILCGLAAAASVMLAACSPDDFPTPSAAGIPQAANYEDAIKIDVDQTTNQVTFSLDAKGVMPVWIIDGKKYSTVNGLQQIYASAGDYEIEVKILNSNGMSDGSVFKTFHIDNTIVDFTRYTTLLSGDGSRQWRIDSDEWAHLACGEPGTDGTNWWAAQANEKDGTGLYDNRLAFDKEYRYTFYPGDAGTIYVNKEVTRYEGHNGTDEADFSYPASEQSALYSFEVQGNDLFLVLPRGTNFPYIPNNDFHDSPRLKVLNLNANKMELVSDNGGIAWHFIFTSKAGAVTFNGFKYDSEFNLWKKANVESPTFWYAPGWNQIADPEWSLDGTTYTVKLPEATTDTWQAQMHIVSDISLSADKTYDFSVILTTSQPHGNITAKLTDTTDDGNFLFVETIKTQAYEDQIFYLSDVKGIDAANVKLVFDFGGNAAGTEVNIKNIVIKDHANDDGTILPSTEPEIPADDVTWQENGPGNLWKAMHYTLFTYYATGNDWQQLPDPEFKDADGTYTLTLPTATVSQWQAQLHFKTDLPTSAATNYDFKCVMQSTTDIKNVTIKMCQDDDDGNVLFEQHADLTAYEECVLQVVDIEGKDAPAMKLVFDFGGCPDNTVVTISSVVFQEHAKPIEWDVNAPNNIWEYSSLTWWYAPGWSQIADPTVKAEGSAFTFTLPEATSDRWQAQMVYHSDKGTSADKTYSFHCVLNSSAAFKIMVKLTVEDDDNTFYFADEVAVEPYEDYVFDRVGMAGIDISKLKLVLDYGGNPANTEITIKDIILLEN